jgi:hypothetical protein
VEIARSAEELDPSSLDVALRIVLVEWWQEPLGTTPTTARTEAGT